MTVDFLKMADSLQEELQEFYQVLRRGGDERKRQVAIERLRRVINQVEPLARDPGEAGKGLAMEQRWGYMRVLSHLGTAMHELKSVGGLERPHAASIRTGPPGFLSACCVAV